MASITDIRSGLKARLETIPGLQVYGYIPSLVEPPAAAVWRRRIDFDSTLDRGSDDFTFAITLFVQRASDPDAQEQLDSYLAGSGTYSVKAAIEADDTLGGAVDFSRVVAVEDDKIAEVNGIKYLATDIVVEAG